ncbi:MAG: hypothetical protein AAB217_22220 [Chloroflexota bacterium]
MLKKPLGFLASNRVLPALLLCFAAVSVFVFQSYTTGFDEGHHGFLSSHGMALAKSLFADGRLLMFIQRSVQEDGQIVVEPYNRFPLFPFLITGSAIRMFEPNLALQVYVARQVMNLFLALSMVVCFRMISELTQNAFLGVAIALIVFSSSPILYYGDMIFNDTPALFGFLLALFLVARSQTSRPPAGLLVLFPVLSVWMGWQPYTVFATWFLVDTLSWLGTNKWSPGNYRSVLARPSVMALAVAVTAGVAIMALQLIYEWAVVGGPLVEIPSIQSIIFRLGLAPTQSYEQYSDILDWGNFSRVQVRNALAMAVPFAGVLPFDLACTPCLLTMTLVGGLLLAGSVTRWKERIRSYTVLLVFTLSGVLWAVLMKDFVAFHNFQSIYYIGLSITLFTLLSSYLNSSAARIIAVVVCLLFILNVRNINAIKQSAAQRANPVTQEFQAIYDKLEEGSAVYVDGDRHQLGVGFHAVDFYLIHTYTASQASAEYVISANPFYNQDRLTDNPHINLFMNAKAP